MDLWPSPGQAKLWELCRNQGDFVTFGATAESPPWYLQEPLGQRPEYQETKCNYWKPSDGRATALAGTVSPPCTPARPWAACLAGHGPCTYVSVNCALRTQNLSATATCTYPCDLNPKSNPGERSSRTVCSWTQQPTAREGGGRSLVYCRGRSP